jgi:hypothetical protein
MMRPTRSAPTVYCELFECEGALARGTMPEPELAIAQSNPRFSEASPFIGLCADCLERAACSSSKTAGGVWHCEEYR